MTSLNLTERGVPPWDTLVSNNNLLNFLDEKSEPLQGTTEKSCNKLNGI